jgi:hypothetical protein
MKNNLTTKFVQHSEKEECATKMVIQSSNNRGENFHEHFATSKPQTIRLHNLLFWMGQTRSYVLNKKVKA